jgi:hypothetical protein
MYISQLIKKCMQIIQYEVAYAYIESKERGEREKEIGAFSLYCSWWFTFVEEL